MGFSNVSKLITVKSALTLLVSIMAQGCSLSAVPLCVTQGVGAKTVNWGPFHERLMVQMNGQTSG